MPREDKSDTVPSGKRSPQSVGEIGQSPEPVCEVEDFSDNRESSGESLVQGIKESYVSFAENSSDTAESENLSEEIVCEIKNSSVNGECSIEPVMEEKKEPASDFAKDRSNRTAPENEPKESVCFSCGSSKFDNDSNNLDQDQLICKCVYELGEVQKENKSNFDNNNGVREPEQVVQTTAETKPLDITRESSVEKPFKKEHSSYPVEDSNDITVSDSASANIVVDISVSPKSASLTESEEKHRGCRSKLAEVNIPLQEYQHTDAVAEEIVQVNVTNNLDESPTVQNESLPEQLQESDVPCTCPVDCKQCQPVPLPDNTTDQNSNTPEPWYKEGLNITIFILFVIIGALIAMICFVWGRPVQYSNTTEETDENSTTLNERNDF